MLEGPDPVPEKLNGQGAGQSNDPVWNKTYPPSDNKAINSPPAADIQKLGFAQLQLVEASSKPEQTDADSQIKKFEQDNGVKVTFSNGRYEYSLNGSKEAAWLIQTTLDLAKASDVLSKKIEEKEQELHNRYHVDFSTDGEPAGIHITTDNGTSYDFQARSRAPQLRELLGIEAALKTSWSEVTEKPGSMGVKFYFLDQQLLPDSLCMFGQDGSRRNAIFFEPDPRHPKIVTDRDANGPFPGGQSSIQGEALHELEHNTVAVDSEWVKPVMADYAKKLGWVPLQSKDGHGNLRDEYYRPIYALETKDGHYYRRGPVPDTLCTSYGDVLDTNHSLMNSLLEDGMKTQWNPPAQSSITEDTADLGWIRCNIHGEFLDKNDKPTKSLVEAVAMNYLDMRTKSKIGIASSYFFDPQEMLAEGMRSYRSAELYLWLKNNHPDLYEICQKIDQEEINRRYPPVNHVPSYVRAADRTLIPNPALKK